MLFPRNTAQIIMAHQYSVNMPIFRVLKQVAKGISQNYKVYFERYFQLLLSQASLTNLSHMIISFKFASSVQFIFIDLISNSGKGQNILPEWVVLGLIQMVENSWQNFRDFLFLERPLLQLWHSGKTIPLGHFCSMRAFYEVIFYFFHLLDLSFKSQNDSQHA